MIRTAPGSAGRKRRIVRPPRDPREPLADPSTPPAPRNDEKIQFCKKGECDAGGLLLVSSLASAPPPSLSKITTPGQMQAQRGGRSPSSSAHAIRGFGWQGDHKAPRHHRRADPALHAQIRNKNPAPDFCRWGLIEKRLKPAIFAAVNKAAGLNCARHPPAPLSAGKRALCGWNTAALLI